MADADSAQQIPFGDIFPSSKGMSSNDFESSLLDYSQPTYSTNFRTSVDTVIQPRIQPYDSGSQLLRFDIGGEDDGLFTDLSTLKVVGRLKVLHEDGSPLEAGEKVSCVNLFPESIFEQINLFVNSVPLNDHGRHIQIKSYIQKLYSSSTEVKKTTLQNEFFIGDSISPGSEDITAERLESDEGLKTRSLLIAGSKDLHFCFKPTLDLANSERAFPAGYTLTLEFERADPKFSLLAPDNSKSYKIRIYDMVLEVRRFSPSPSALKALPNPKTGTFYLPFSRTTTRFRAVPVGVGQYLVPRIADGSTALPYHVLIVPLSNTQCTSISKNPYVFSTKKIKKYSLLLNSACIPSKPLEIKKNAEDNVRVFRHFLENTGFSDNNVSNGIEPYGFLHHDFCMSFDLTSDNCLGACNHRPEVGVLDFSVEFEEPLEEAITFLVIASYESCLKLQAQEVSLNYAL